MALISATNWRDLQGKQEYKKPAKVLFFDCVIRALNNGALSQLYSSWWWSTPSWHGLSKSWLIQKWAKGTEHRLLGGSISATDCRVLIQITGNYITCPILTKGNVTARYALLKNIHLMCSFDFIFTDVHTTHFSSVIVSNLYHFLSLGWVTIWEMFTSFPYVIIKNVFA